MKKTTEFERQNRGEGQPRAASQGQRRKAEGNTRRRRRKRMQGAVEGIGYLVGTWRGEGRGLYPTIDCFAYKEELTFCHPDPRKPVLTYSQRTWNPLTSHPMHSESGFWRPKLDGSLEVVLAQSTGLVEVQKGTFDADQKVICLKSDLVGNASKVKDITRVFKLVNGELSYVVEMATAMTSLQPHLKAVLRKV